MKDQETPDKPAPVLRGTFQQQCKQLAGWLKEIDPNGETPEGLR